MFKINGKPAYSKAYLAYEPVMGERCSSGLASHIRDSTLTIHGEREIQRRYPQRLDQALKDLPPLPSDRPLWMFHLGNKLIFASPENEHPVEETAISESLGDDIAIVDLEVVRAGVEGIRFVDFPESQNSRQFSPDKLTIWQAAQIFSAGNCYFPKSVKLSHQHQGPFGVLFADIIFRASATDEDGFPERFDVCKNLKRITFPLQEVDVPRVKFARNSELYDTVFVLDMRLIA